MYVPGERKVNLYFCPDDKNPDEKVLSDEDTVCDDESLFIHKTVEPTIIFNDSFPNLKLEILIISIISRIKVAVGVRVGTTIEVGVRVGTTIEVGVRVGITIAVGVRVGTTIEVGVRVGTTIEVGVRVGITIAVGVGAGTTISLGVKVGTIVAVGVGVGTTVAVGVRVGCFILFSFFSEDIESSFPLSRLLTLSKLFEQDRINKIKIIPIKLLILIFINNYIYMNR